MNEILVRSAEIEDLDILLSFEQGIITAERPFEPTLKPDEIHYYDVEQMIHSNDTEIVVATIDDEIVGSGYVKMKKSKPFQKFGHHAYIGFMYVKPEHRGKGISQIIMDRLLAWSRSNDLLEVRLDVYEGNAPAIRAYGKAGYEKHLVTMRLDLTENEPGAR